MKSPARLSALLTATALATTILSGAANAQSVPDAHPQQDPGDPGFTTGLFGSSRSTLLSDTGGIRTALGNLGVTVGLQDTEEVFGNATGGINRGAGYDGLTMASLGIDTEKAFGWEGGTFNVSALQIHGRSFSADNFGTLQTASGIEADRATRLWELWYQQAFLDGKFDVKVGQQSIDQEFMTSTYSGLFINTMMGWPMIPSVDLYGGGPAYPLSSLGVRFRGQPIDNLTLLAGVFDDNPSGGAFADASQLRGAEAMGTRFNLDTGALFIAEAQYAINQPAVGQIDKGGAKQGLPGTYKIGFWYDSGNFPDQRFGTDGLSLANPNSNGDPAMHRGNYSIYAVADQQVWQPADPQDPRSVGVFARVMGAPENQNMVTFSVNAGVDFKAPIPGRDDDTVGLGYGLARISDRLSQYDQDVANFNGGAYPVQSTESFIELTYQAQLAPWWQVQPDFQYVFTPSGGVPNPNNPTQRIGNEAIFGARTNIVF